MKSCSSHDFFVILNVVVTSRNQNVGFGPLVMDL